MKYTSFEFAILLALCISCDRGSLAEPVSGRETMLGALEALGGGASAEVAATTESSCDVATDDEFLKVRLEVVWTPMPELAIGDLGEAFINTRSMKNSGAPDGGRYFTILRRVSAAEFSPTVDCGGDVAQNGDIWVTLNYSLPYVQEFGVSETEAREVMERAYAEGGSSEIREAPMIFESEE